jgi:transcriptional regulator with XRE-family HTH domain
MNRKREAYDRLAVGDRIRKKRVQLGFSQDEVAERIDRAPKYCSDIERGTCGMSTETMLAISKCLDMSLDYMMFGEQTDEEAKRQENDELAVIHILSRCSKQQRDYAIRLLKLYIASMQIS